jgi:hypothetical protein
VSNIKPVKTCFCMLPFRFHAVRHCGPEFRSVGHVLVWCNNESQTKNRTARSSCDFSVWAITKKNIFSQNPRDLEHIRVIIEAESEKVDEDKFMSSHY